MNFFGVKLVFMPSLSWIDCIEHQRYDLVMKHQSFNADISGSPGFKNILHSQWSWNLRISSPGTHWGWFLQWESKGSHLHSQTANSQLSTNACYQRNHPSLLLDQGSTSWMRQQFEESKGNKHPSSPSQDKQYQNTQMHIANIMNILNSRKPTIKPCCESFSSLPFYLIFLSAMNLVCTWSWCWQSGELFFLWTYQRYRVGYILLLSMQTIF